MRNLNLFSLTHVSQICIPGFIGKLHNPLWHALEHFEFDNVIRESQLLWVLFNCPRLKSIKIRDVEMDVTQSIFKAASGRIIKLRTSVRRFCASNLTAYHQVDQFLRLIDLFPRLKKLDLELDGESGDAMAAYQMLHNFIDRCTSLNHVILRNFFDGWPNIHLPSNCIRPNLKLEVL